MLARARQSRNDREAHRWLAERIGDAIAGLIPIVGGTGTLAEEARKYLCRLKAEGFDPVLRNHFQELAPAARAMLWREVIEQGEELPPVFDASTTPKWLARLCNKRRTRRPLGRGWLFPHRLPEVVLGKHRLNDAQKNSLLAALRHSSLARPHPLVNTLCRYVEPVNRDAFAWAVFDQWDSRDQPPYGAWALRTIGLVGGDSSAVRLAHLIEVWLKEARWRSARLGLECLCAVGTDAALMQVFWLVRKLRSRRWTNLVRGWLRQTAERKHLSLGQLSDCSVPTLGLDDHGRCVFSYGRRSFRVAVGPSLQARVLDDNGRRIAALPEPNSRDHLAIALPAFDEWFYFRKRLRQVREVLGHALEEAMIAGRRWSRATFQTLFVRHALMFQLARALLWGGYSARKELCFLFRLNEDGSWIDERERPVDTEQIAKVGLVHPLYLREEQRQIWGEMFANDELAAPFPQLARPLVRLQAKERQGDTIRRFEDLDFPALALLKTLKQLGWRRSEYDYDAHFLTFPENDVMAIIRYSPGIPEESFQGKEYQSQLHCYFVRGCPEAGQLPRADLAMNLSGVDPVIVSEVLGHLNVLALKGE
jgi:hypothetical protein